MIFPLWCYSPEGKRKERLKNWCSPFHGRLSTRTIIFASRTLTYLCVVRCLQKKTILFNGRFDLITFIEHQKLPIIVTIDTEQCCINKSCSSVSTFSFGIICSNTSFWLYVFTENRRHVTWSIINIKYLMDNNKYFIMPDINKFMMIY